MTYKIQFVLSLVMVLLLLVIYTVWYQLGVFAAMFQLLGWYVIAVPVAAIAMAFVSVWKHE